MEMPSEEEQMIAEEYVLNKPMLRPDTDAKKAIKYALVYIVVSAILGFIAYYLFGTLGVFSYLPEGITEFRAEHPVWFNILFFLIIYFITALICAKSAAIGCIRMYQHYAPEDMRRRCLFKPTCSEYAILAIQKYGLIIGLIKAYIRLFHKCRGNIYRIDYP